MSLTSGGLLIVALMVGCAIQSVSDDPATPAKGSDRAGSEPVDPSAPPPDDKGQGKDESFKFRLRSGEGPTYRGGLLVVARNSAGKVGEGYRVRVFACVPRGPGKPDKRVTLGEQDVFRPPGVGEKISIVIDEVKPEAWVKGKEGYELKLGVEAMPAKVGRKQPNVSLKVVDTKAAP